MDTNRLLEIALNLGFEDLQKDIQWLSNRMSQTNSQLILPLVGEFSAGKTTLLNALTDNKKLETATKPTTATIYEIHFGCDSNHAQVIYNNGETKDVKNIEELKNADLIDAKVVIVYDTSTKVPASTIIVDTPGLSSPNPQHKQTLVEFLPKADGILLVIDINQGLTKSTTDQPFLKTIALSERPIYVVFTQCDTKSAAEIDAQKKYLKENSQIPIKDVVCVSGKNGNLEELYQLLDKIQKDKDNILGSVNQKRLENLSNIMLNRIDELLKASHSDKELEDAVRKQKLELERMDRNIDNLIMSLSDEIERSEKKTISEYEEIIFNKLDTLVAGRSANFDAEAVSAINATTSLMLHKYKESVRDTLVKNARARKDSNDAVSLRSLEDIDVASLTIQGTQYNLNLNTLGHEKDTLIAGIATAAVIVGAGVAGGAAAGAGGAFDALDTATDVIFDGGRMLGHAKDEIESQKQVEKKNTNEEESEPKDSEEEIHVVDNSAQRAKIGGMVTQLVSFFTDEFMGKPQRRRVIHDYMDGTLIPFFSSEIKGLSRTLIDSISNSLHAEASQTVNEMNEALNQLRTQLSEQKSEYQKKIDELKEYKTELQK